MERVQEMGETTETVLGMWDGIQVHSSFHTDVKELEYKDLLTNTFTQTDYERDMKILGVKHHLRQNMVILSVCFAHTCIIIRWTGPSVTWTPL